MQTAPVKSVPAASGSKAAHTGETMNTYQRPVPVVRKNQNSHILTGAANVIPCTEWLKTEGFTIIRVEIGEHALPVVTIQLCGKCNLLKEHYKAVNYKSEGGAFGRRENHWKSDLLGCRVEWVERGH